MDKTVQKNRLLSALCLTATLIVLGAATRSSRSQAALEALPRAIGTPLFDLVEPEDTLLDIAVKHAVGFEALSRLNPEVDVWIPVPGTVVQIPSQALLPHVALEGLVINIPEMRLFDFTVEGGPVFFAAAVGDPDDPTPRGVFQIRDKRIDPIWSVPKSIREEKPHLPDQVPAGPANPLGSRWMRIGWSSYGIHGTNTRWSIGREATHGCVRLYERDIQALFERTPEGTPLQIVYQPYKWGRNEAQILFEAHPDRYNLVPESVDAALGPIRELGLLDRVDISRVRQAIEEALGIPIPVGTLPQ